MIQAVGTYQMDITGDGVAETIRGRALYGEGTSEDLSYFGIIFADSDEHIPEDIDSSDGNFGAILRQRDGNVGSGTYQVADLRTTDLDSGDRPPEDPAGLSPVGP